MICDCVRVCVVNEIKRKAEEQRKKQINLNRKESAIEYELCVRLLSAI